METVLGKLEIVAFITSKTSISDFYSFDWNEDYNGLKFSIAKASILGYQNLPAYDEHLVRKLIEKITVFDDHLDFLFKSGIQIEIKG